MSLFAPTFQIASDLHLETPLTKPEYDTFHLTAQADNILLLGDIGLVVDAGLFQFLRCTLEGNRGCRIFYVLGNHEPYRTTYEQAHQMLRDFEEEAKDEFGGRFRFLSRDRFDLNEHITILGCTLWSAIQPDQEAEVASRSTDLHSERGIQDWTLQRHQEEHDRDLTWLNDQVSMIERNEPHRHVIIATHYNPTMDSRANDPRHEGSSVSSNFVTDLPKEPCWISPNVKLWAFGHTHYSCAYRNERTGKLVLANQRGYSGLGGDMKSKAMKVSVVKAGEGDWEVVEPPKRNEKRLNLQRVEAEESRTRENDMTTEQKGGDVKTAKASLMQRLRKRIHGLHPLRKEL